MKKALFALSVALIAAASAAPEALAAEARTEPVGVYAVVTDGTRHYTGSTQSWEQLRDGQAYELYVQKQPVLSVGAALSCGFYAARFERRGLSHRLERRQCGGDPTGGFGQLYRRKADVPQ